MLHSRYMYLVIRCPKVYDIARIKKKKCDAPELNVSNVRVWRGPVEGSRQVVASGAVSDGALKQTHAQAASFRSCVVKQLSEEYRKVDSVRLSLNMYTLKSIYILSYIFLLINAVFFDFVA